MGFLISTIAPDKTFRLPLLDLPAPEGKQPALLIRYGGEGNDGFRNAMFNFPDFPGKQSVERERMIAREAAPIYAQHLVAGWEDIYEAGSTEPCPFSVEKANELLLQYAERKPSFLLTIRNVALFEPNFRDAARPSASALGKE